MDDFTKAMLDKAKARREATRQKMSEHSYQASGGRKVDPSASKENSSTTTNSTTTQDKPKTAVSERLQRLAERRKMWALEEKGEKVDYSKVLTPKKTEDPGTNSPVKKVEIKPERKAKLSALSRRYQDTNDDDQVDFSIAANNMETEEMETNTQHPVSPVQIGPSAETTTKPPTLNNQDSMKRKAEQQPFPTKRKSLGSASVQQSPVVQSPVVQTSGINKDVITCSSTPKQTDLNQQQSPQMMIQTASLQVDTSFDNHKLPEEQQHEEQEEEEQEGKWTTTSVDNNNIMTSSSDEHNDNSMTSTNDEGASFGESDLDDDSTSYHHHNDNNDNDEEHESSYSIDDTNTSSQAHHHQHDDDDDVYDDVIDGYFANISATSNALLNSTDVTINKSSRQIRDELNDRGSVFNEAEDTRIIVQRRQSRRQLLSPPTSASAVPRQRLTRSNSTESLLSPSQSFNKKTTSTTIINTEKQVNPNTKPPQQDIPVFTIDAYRSHKRKSIASRMPPQKVATTSTATTTNRYHSTTGETPQSKYKLQTRKPYKEKIKEIEEGISRQLSLIKQASTALNHAYDVKHGKGSRTEIEFEKLLLVASKTRLVLMDELAALKKKSVVEYERDHTNQSGGVKPCHAKINITKIALPIRTEHLFAQANKREGDDMIRAYYVILVKTKGSGKLLSTDLETLQSCNVTNDQLMFKNNFTIENLTSDFEIVFEVYSSRSSGKPSDGSSRDKSKFSSVFSKSSSSLRNLTPKRFRSRAASSSIASPSPGGPNAVRTSTFNLIGTCTVTKADVKEQLFELANVPFLSSITGKLHLKLDSFFQSSVEQCGFLTIFDDVGGLGAWNRLWCMLYGGVLYAWQLAGSFKPNTEDLLRTKAKLRIPLYQCISESVTTVDRLRCARPNTFELRTMRKRNKNDKDNLITSKTGSVITIKHLIAAESREDKEEWIIAMNQSLADVREWDPQALQPFHYQ